MSGLYTGRPAGGTMSHGLTGFCSKETPPTFATSTRQSCNLSGDLTMQWQKPQATDLRYGFEITMYISAR